MNYSPDGDSMGHAAEIDQSFVNFFGIVQSFIRSSFEYKDVCEALNNGISLDALALGGLLATQSWDDNDRAFHAAVQATETEAR